MRDLPPFEIQGSEIVRSRVTIPQWELKAIVPGGAQKEGLLLSASRVASRGYVFALQEEGED